MGLDTLIVTIVVAALGYAPFAVLRLYDRIVSSSRETVGLVNDLLDLSERVWERSESTRPKTRRVGRRR